LKKALITGIAGQDGSYLAELLLAKGYEVHGIELPLCDVKNVDGIRDRIHLHLGLIRQPEWLEMVLREVDPDECYHLAASSFVSYSPNDEDLILSNNILSTQQLFSALKQLIPKCKVFFASTAEMFGCASTSPQNEETSFNPKSIYGISKVSGYHLVKYYRRHHGLFSCSGVLYNHESPRRGEHFVTRKITKTAAKIKLGLVQKLYLGNLEAVRDWGYAPDYVKAMWLMLQQETPSDYVLATGVLHSVRDFVDITFRSLALDYRDFVEIDPCFYRDAELVPLCGDSSKAKSVLGWESRKSLEEIVAEMVDHDLSILNAGRTSVPAM